MRRRHHLKHLLIALWLSILCASAAQADLFIVAHVPNDATMNEGELLDILRGAQRNWSSGFGARVALPSRDSMLYDDVSRTLFNASGATMQRNWFKLVFAGRANAPVYLDNDEATIQFVTQNLGTIGVVQVPPATPENSTGLVIKAIES
jgi:ABC-type phosphate transport system substrate-binding protein